MWSILAAQRLQQISATETKHYNNAVHLNNIKHVLE